MGVVIVTDPRADRALAVRQVLEKVIAKHLGHHGDDLAGFAIVTWDMLGGAMSGYATEVGPVSESMCPSYVADALNRHIAVRIAQENASTHITGDDDPAA